MIGPIFRDTAPRRAVVDAHTIGLQFVACRTPVQVGQRAPVVSKSQAQVVVVQFSGGLADDTGGLDA